MTEFIQIIFSWSGVVLIISIVFLMSQRKAVTDLIGRIIRVKFPGGEIGANYKEPTLPKKNPVKEDKNTLEKDFDGFIFSGLYINKAILDNLVNALWRKFLLEMPHIKLTNASDKFKSLISRKLIDSKANDDFNFIEETLGKAIIPRQEAIQAFVRSNLLIDYLRSIATKQ